MHKLYNRKFGPASRKVIAHMPHYINKAIMEDLVAAFPAEWDATSSHQLRSGADMQYAFAYMYYMMGQAREFDAEAEFVRLDVDGDGLLGVNELRTLVTRAFPLPTTVDAWQRFERILLNCSALQPPLEALGVAVGPEAREVWVTATLVARCDNLTALLREGGGKKLVNKFELHNDEDDIVFKVRLLHGLRAVGLCGGAAVAFAHFVLELVNR